MIRAVIGALRVNLGLDSAQFHRGARGVQSASARMRKQLTRVAAASTAMGAAVSAAALAGARQIDEAAKSARRLDSTIGGFRALELSASEAGVSLSGLTNDIQTMNRELASIGISGNGARALEALSLQVKDIQGLDADEKLAVIADRVETLGLSAGKTTAILRDLGVRNREMALLVLQGGDAIRAAREDIRDYGLEISAVDASNVERANDQLGRLGLISQYVGQQLAIQLVPSFGRLAEAITDSLREGGSLRRVLDGLLGITKSLTDGVATLVDNLDLLGSGLAVLAATRIPAMIAGLATMVSGLTVAGVAATGLSVAASALAGTVALLGGPLGILAAAGAGLAIWKLRAGEAEQASYDAATGTAALMGELDVFRDTVAPDAAARVIDLANANHELAASALSAAKAELAKQRSLLDIANTSGAGGTGGSIRDMGLSPSLQQRRVLERDRQLTKAEKALAQTLRDRDLAAKTVALTMSEVKASDQAAAKSTRELSVELDASAKGLGGAAKQAKELVIEFNGPFVRAIEGVSDAFGDFFVRGLRDFSDFRRNIISSFTSMISQMVATAARNKLVISLGATGPSGAATAVNGGGILSSLTGGGGNLLSSLLGGGSTGLLSGLGGIFSGGGLVSSFANLGGLLGGSVGGLGALGAAIPAIGVIALGISAIIGKTKEIDNGLSVAVSSAGTVVRSFREIEKSRFFGLSKSRRVRFSSVSSAVSDPIANAVADLQTNVVDMAATLGVAAESFEGFSYRFQVSLKGLNESQRTAAVEAQLNKLGDAFAGLAVGSEFVRDGEGAVAALARLSASLQVVNQTMDALQLTLFDVSVGGADAASRFADIFGGLEGFAQTTSAYYQEFFTEAERVAFATQAMSMELKALGVDSLPRSRAAFRALVDEANALGDRDLTASLISLAPAFAEITAQSDALLSSLENNTLFRTAQDAQFAQTANGFGQALEDLADISQTPDLLREVVRAIREGDINNARLTSKLVEAERRRNLEANL